MLILLTNKKYSSVIFFKHIFGIYAFPSTFFMQYPKMHIKMVGWKHGYRLNLLLHALEAIVFIVFNQNEGEIN